MLGLQSTSCCYMLTLVLNAKHKGLPSVGDFTLFWGGVLFVFRFLFVCFAGSKGISFHVFIGNNFI